MITPSFRLKNADHNTQDLGNLNASLRASNLADPVRLLQMTITPTMLNNLITTPILVLPSPGTGSYYQVLATSLTFNYNGSPYAQVGSGGDLFYGSSNSGALINGGLSNFNGSLTNTFSTYTNSAPSTLPTNTNLNTIKNMPIYIVSFSPGSGYSGGNSTITYNVIYTVNRI